MGMLTQGINYRFADANLIVLVGFTMVAFLNIVLTILFALNLKHMH